jgi:hypothetical protein
LIQIFVDISLSFLAAGFEDSSPPRIDAMVVPSLARTFFTALPP